MASSNKAGVLDLSLPAMPSVLTDEDDSNGYMRFQVSPAVEIARCKAVASLSTWLHSQCKLMGLDMKVRPPSLLLCLSSYASLFALN